MIKEVILRFILCIFKIIPIYKNKILFVNYNGRGYGDNAKYIHEQLIKKNVKCYWVLNNFSDKMPDDIIKVKNKSILYFYHLFTSKIIEVLPVFLNPNNPEFSPLKCLFIISNTN